MIGILTFIIATIVLAITFKLFSADTYILKKERTYNGQTYTETETNAVGVTKAIGVVLLSVVLGFLNPYEVERVDSGHVAILVENLGDDKGMSKVEYKRGWVIFNAFTQRYYEFPVFQQHIDYEENTVITRGGFQATIKPSFNYSLNPTTVDAMFQNLRVDIKTVEHGWLKNAIISSVNDVANLFTVDSIFNHRAEFEAAIISEANKRVGKWFTVSQLRTNIAPPPAITKAIEEKTKAVQEAQAATQRTLVATAEAQEKIARAKGDSAQAVIAAAGRAEAVKKEQQFLTPLYIEYLKVQKWKGEVPTTVLGGNSNALLNIKP
jgi:regulator of protease activity HflC (stomatin/prohibitin superfamily)